MNAKKHLKAKAEIEIPWHEMASYHWNKVGRAHDHIGNGGESALKSLITSRDH